MSRDPGGDTVTRVHQVRHRRPLQHLGRGGRFGVIALATDFNIEQELRLILPPGVQIFTSRVRNANPLTIENLRSMSPGISAAADSILPGTPLDVMMYACTSGTVAIGSRQVRDRVHQARPGIPVTNPVDAAMCAFRVLGARRISILTPYTSAVNQEVAKVFGGARFVLNIAGFGFEDDTAMTFIDPQDLFDAAIEVCDPRADLLFVSCTALRVAGVIERIESRIGKPVVSSNQALAWHALQLSRCREPVDGYGRLMQCSSPLSATSCDPLDEPP